MNYHATPATGPIPLTPAFIAFYATTATVIPVLFLAIAVQGSAYQSMLNSVVRVARSSLGAGPLRRRVGRMGRLLLFLIPYLILLLTVGGECLSLFALCWGYEAYGIRDEALLATFLLLAVIIAGPAVALFKTINAAVSDRDGSPEPAETATYSENSGS